ncbi:succinate dehydrogenase cytochrome b subunit [Balneolaceae bacterium ANBcel3]|nr:succinate dehydrogenase cytochrome b subunit [Balneolaceae bacterium ANBcel3]
MSKAANFLTSQVGRKIATGITGFGLVLFMIVHLLGNLAYFAGPEAINTYSHTLHQMGPILWVVRLGLLAFFLYHAWLGISIWLERRKARPEAYHVYDTRGGVSRYSWSSRSMIVTGILLLLFVITHLQTFAFHDFEYAVYGGVEMHDVHQRLTEVFQSPVYTIYYVIIMVLLGMHLRHGVWSAFQSMGWMSRRTNPMIYTAAFIVAVLIAAGFIGLPLSIYFELV